MTEESSASSPPSRPPPKTKRFTWRRIVLGGLLLALAAMTVYALIPGRTPQPNPELEPSQHHTIAIFGASGTAGDGVLKAALADPNVKTIHVITRRSTPRIDQGVAAGRVEMTTHMDYEDYGPLAKILPTLDAVYWALGTSAANVDDEQYSVIHVDFPVAFVRTWLEHARPGSRSFHLISGQGASADAWSHWAREKARTERELSALVEDTNVRVVSYRPSYIAPSEERTHFGHSLAHAVFGPFKLAIRSTAIGRAMLEVTARSDTELPNGTILENKDILNYAAAYEQRHAQAHH
ncbi:MAG: hypothetical protein AAGF11_29345 [Myxococcota bacterium]